MGNATVDVSRWPRHIGVSMADSANPATSKHKLDMSILTTDLVVGLSIKSTDFNNSQIRWSNKNDTKSTVSINLVLERGNANLTKWQPQGKENKTLTSLKTGWTPDEYKATLDCSEHFIHTYIHTNTHTYIHTYLHTYIRLEGMYPTGKHSLQPGSEARWPRQSWAALVTVTGQWMAVSWDSGKVQLACVLETVSP